MLGRVVAGALIAPVLFALGPAHAHAQDWQAQWKQITDKAKGQSLAIVSQDNPAYDATINEFGRRFGVKIEETVARPSSALSRIQTEQKNGQFVWDAWIGGTSNMVNSGVPGGLLEPMEKFFILPEVKDTKNWRHADFMFGEQGHHVFTHVNKLEFYILRNATVLKDVKTDTWEDLLNPKLKGKISVRDLSVPNSGTFGMVGFYHAMGAEKTRKFFKEQDVHVYENPQQLDQALRRGGQALAVGIETNIWDQCRADGGCKEIEQLRQYPAAVSLGTSIPKNPPHKEAVTAWINWFLSKEGQQAWVDNWAKSNSYGALSMRADVQPAPGHERDLPDFHKPEQYVFVSSDRGSKEVEGFIKVFKEATER
jgi:ABC-type Fe3+ transport system substrate-binding protein